MSRLQKLLGVGKGYLERLPPVDVHKLLRIVLMNLPYIVIFYVGNKLAWLYQYCVGDSMIERLMVLILNFQMAFSRILPSMHKNELLVGITGAVAVKLMVYMKGKNAKKFRQGVEYGSARWGTAKDIAPFIDPVFENNILLTMTERLTMNGRPKNPKFARNKNVIVIGGSGSGKTRFYVKPNLMQMGKYISYVVTDPKGTIIIECGKMLVRHTYFQISHSTMTGITLEDCRKEEVKKQSMLYLYGDYQEDGTFLAKRVIIDRFEKEGEWE